MYATHERPFERGYLALDLVPGKNPGVETQAPGLPGPLLKVREVLFRVGQLEGPFFDPFNVGAYLVSQTRPQILGEHDKGKLSRVPALLPDPAPGSAGLLACYLTLLHDGDFHTLLGEVIRRAAPDNPRPDDDHVGFRIVSCHSLLGPGLVVHTSAATIWREMVPPTGFEPVISALKGRCPWPLDDGGARKPIG